LHFCDSAVFFCSKKQGENMASMTLAEFIKRSRDSLITGIAQDIYTTDPMYDYIPWIPYIGSGATYNRETVMGDSQYATYGTAITAKATSTVTPVLYRGITVVGDAEINKQQVAESGGDGGDLIVSEVSSKAKSVGRKIRTGIAVGSGVVPEMNSMHTLCDASQYATSVAGGAALSFERMDELANLVKSKDGFVDFYVASGREMRKIRSLYRALGGVPMIDVQLGDRTYKVLEFNGVPIFQNDYLSTTETDSGAALVGGTQSSMYAGVWDDGSQKIGAALIYPAATDSMGINVEQIGSKEGYDEEVYRVKFYGNFALFNRRGLARLPGISGV
jgi:hypothetical protein